jgi:uncharacterized membrane protein YfcA
MIELASMKTDMTVPKQPVRKAARPEHIPFVPPRSTAALLYAAPIGLLGGLIGLGGAEFRLPVLAGPLGYPARQAVPLNLLVSFVTLFASLLIRGSALSLAPLAPFTSGILAMTIGAMVAAFFGVALADRVSDQSLEQIILMLLVMIGCMLIVEGFLPQQLRALLPSSTVWHVGAGVCFGLMIGLVSSLLGVAGGELIIPTMVFAYGCDIRTAGTASLIISLPTVLVGVLRHLRRGAFTERRTLTGTVLPMGVGSIVGAVAGGLLVGIIPASWLKVLLGVILNVSAVRIFRHSRAHS